jgi:hypothetical protein
MKPIASRDAAHLENAINRAEIGKYIDSLGGFGGRNDPIVAIIGINDPIGINHQGRSAQAISDRVDQAVAL